MQINLPEKIQHIFQILNDNNYKAYLVGGVVRDAIINGQSDIKSTSKDYDIEVFGITFDDLFNFLKVNLDYPVTTEGESYKVLKIHYESGVDPLDISVPRTEKTTGAGYKDFEVTEDSTLSISEAGKRRDITINAIYYDPINKKIVDPFNGEKDIKDKLIRAVDASSFVEDPLRVLRIMQFVARFDYNVEPETLKLCTKITQDGLLDSLTKDRVREEFLKFVYKCKRPSSGIVFLKNIGALQIYMPEILDLAQTKQTPEWHPEGSVFNHTMQVINAGAEIADREGLSNYERGMLIFSTLYHDSGKATTTVFDEKDKVYRAHGHADAGVPLVSSMVKRLNLPKYLEKSLPVLVRLHMHLPVLFYNFKKGEDQTKAVARVIMRLQEAGCDIHQLLWLVEADRRGRKEGFDDSFEPYPASFLSEYLRFIEWFNDTLQKLEVHASGEKEAISGAWILEVMAKPQGVWVGGVKEVIKDLLLTHEFIDKKKRFEMYKADGQVQEEIITNVYGFLEGVQSEFEWSKIIEDEKIRDLLIERFILNRE